jgi:beta-xylosidase
MATHTFQQSGNPIIRHLYTADPAAIVVNDTVYLYTGHDEAPIGIEEYVMHDWRCFSTTDMQTWTEYPVSLSAKDFAWAKDKAYASQVIARHGKFYWYVAVEHKTISGRAIGVAIADHPQGPFKDARGSALISTADKTNEGASMDIIDPAVIIDDDEQAYLFWGKEQCYYAPLHNNMTELAGPIRAVALPGFMEGAHIHKNNDWYYLSYGYEMPEKVAYAMSRSVHGPWEFKGILNELAGNCETNRPAILYFKGQSYFIYHNGGLKDGGSHRRSICIDYLYYNPDHTIRRVIMTTEGVKTI